MATVTESIEMAVPPETAWALVGDPEAISDWHPAIATSEVIERVRRCTLVGGGNLVEPIIEHSERDRFYVYDIAEGPFPTRTYRSRIGVEAAEGGSRLVWQTEFEPEDPASEQELIATFAGIYRNGLEAVSNRLVGAPSPA